MPESHNIPYLDALDKWNPSTKKENWSTSIRYNQCTEIWHIALSLCMISLNPALWSNWMMNQIYLRTDTMSLAVSAALCKTNSNRLSSPSSRPGSHVLFNRGAVKPRIRGCSKQNIYSFMICNMKTENCMNKTHTHTHTHTQTWQYHKLNHNDTQVIPTNNKQQHDTVWLLQNLSKTVEPLRQNGQTQSSSN